MHFGCFTKEVRNVQQQICLKMPITTPNNIPLMLVNIYVQCTLLNALLATIEFHDKAPVSQEALKKIDLK